MVITFRNTVSTLLIILLMMMGTCNLYAQQLKSDTIFTINTPSVEFFGSCTLVLETDGEWICDLGNDYSIKITPVNSIAVDDYWEPYIDIKLYHNENNSSSNLVIQNQLATPHRLTGLKIATNAEETIISSFGGENIFFEKNCKIPALCSSSKIVASSSAKYKIISAVNDFEPFNSRQKISFSPADVENPEEKAYVGTWIYLDKVTPKSGRIQIGGRYSLEVIENPDDKEGFLLIYLDGITDPQSLWEEGDIKGILKPTSFPGHFDLVWYDNHRRPIDLGEASATFQGENLLTLDFPLFESQIRFQRIQ